MQITKTREDIIRSAGKAMKAMRYVINNLNKIGLTADANVLIQAEEELRRDCLYCFEDTKPIEISDKSPAYQA